MAAEVDGGRGNHSSVAVTIRDGALPGGEDVAGGPDEDSSMVTGDGGRDRKAVAMLASRDGQSSAGREVARLWVFVCLFVCLSVPDVRAGRACRP